MRFDDIDIAQCRDYLQNQIKQNNRKLFVQGNSLIKSLQRVQSPDMPAIIYEKAAAARFRTRMTRIARIFADIFDQDASRFASSDNKPHRSQRTQSKIGELCAPSVLWGGLTLFAAWLTRIYTYPCTSVSSAKSVFYFTPPGLICVHPRLLFSKEYEKICNELERTLYDLPATRKAV